jgi:hypothetical protein
VIRLKREKQTVRDELRARALVRDRDGGVCVECRVPCLRPRWGHHLNSRQPSRGVAPNGHRSAVRVARGLSRYHRMLVLIARAVGTQLTNSRSQVDDNEMTTLAVELR